MKAQGLTRTEYQRKRRARLREEAKMNGTYRGVGRPKLVFATEEERIQHHKSVARRAQIKMNEKLRQRRAERKAAAKAKKDLQNQLLDIASKASAADIRAYIDLISQQEPHKQDTLPARDTQMTTNLRVC